MNHCKKVRDIDAANLHAFFTGHRIHQAYGIVEKYRQDVFWQEGIHVRLLAFGFILVLLVMTALVRVGADASRAAGASDKETTLVDAAQMAVLWPARGKPQKIWLERLTTETVTGKTSLAAKTSSTWPAKKRTITAVQLADGDVFAIHPVTGKFSKYDELTRKFVDGAGMVAGDQPPPVITKIAQGSGTTPAEALQDAYRNAVRLAVGVLVDNEVQIEKDDVVSDKVLTYSEGFIVKYRELSRKEENGLVRITISADVAERKLVEELKLARITLCEMSGKDLVASALTRKEARENGAVLISRKLADLPNLLVVEGRKPTTLDYDAETQILCLVVDVRVDMTRYRDFVQSLTSTLERVSIARASTLLRVVPYRDTNNHLVSAVGSLPPVLMFGPDLSGLPRSWCLWLLSAWDENVTRTRWTAYALDVDAGRALAGLKGELLARIRLLDAEGQIVLEETFDPLKAIRRQSHWFGWLEGRPRPLTLRGDALRYGGLYSQKDSAGKTFPIDDSRTLNSYVTPVCVTGLGNGNILYSPGVWQVLKVKISPEKLARVKDLKGKMVLIKPKSPSTR